MSDTTRPTLSVGLPVYNGERFLEETLDSILAQTYEDFELIISDNASTDGTEMICRRYASQDARVRYVRQPTNLGAANNYNHVVALARGRYFRWAAHDDLCSPTNFERCMEIFDSAPADVALVYPQTLIIDANGDVIRPYEDGLDLRDHRPSRRLHKLIVNLGLSNAIFGIIRSDVLRQTRLVGPFVGSDEVLLAEISLLGQMWEVPERLFLRRLHAQRSLEAFPDSHERTSWFDPSVNNAWALPRTRILLADSRSVLTLPLPPATRLRAVLTLFGTYLSRWWKVIVREVQREMVQTLARNRSRFRGGTDKPHHHQDSREPREL
ncbi:MAG: glycosyltransferase [Actinobacteria bacterium]|nr:glycosyltransferase [Actinomycetota bacterium]